MTDQPETPTAQTAAEAAAEQPAKTVDPDKTIRVRWDGPPRLVPDYAAAIRSHHPDRNPPLLEPGDIVEIPARQRTTLHGDTTSEKAPAVNVPKET